MSGNSAPAYSHANRQPHTSQANGLAKPVRSTTWESQGQYDDDRVYQASSRASSLHKKTSRDVIPSGDQDGMYVKSSTKGKMGPPASVRGRGAKKSPSGSPVDPEADQSNWIHRDKLKEIEIREMEEAGFRVGRTSRSNSRSQSASRRARDRTNSDLTEGFQNGDERYERRIVSPIPAEDEEALADQHYHAWSPTGSDGPAPEMQPPSRTNHTVRPSTSRIPLPKTSGIPVPAAVADRDAPLPRSRTSSTNWTGDIAAAGARVRSGSIGSQVLLDDFVDERKHGHVRNNSSSASASSMKQPPKSSIKAKTPGKSAAATRKTSTTSRTQSKSRQVSGTNKRPGTSGNAVSRPTTGHRPEERHPGSRPCTNLILAFRQTSRSFPHTQSGCSKSSGRTRAELGLCTTQTFDCSTLRKLMDSVCRRSILSRSRRRGRMISGLFQAQRSKLHLQMKSWNLLPTSLQQSSSLISSSHQPYLRAPACLRHSQHQSSALPARKPRPPDFQSRPKTCPRRRANAALSCSIRSCIYPFPFHLKDILPTKSFRSCTWRSSAGWLYPCILFHPCITGLIAYSVL